MSGDDRGGRGDRPACTEEDRPDADSVRAALGRLAGDDRDAVIDRAEVAVEDLELAVEFVETAGLDGLEAAIAETDDPERAARGERALAAFRQFRAAANGELRSATEDGLQPTADGGSRSAGDGEPETQTDGEREEADHPRDHCHFHRGRGTDLRRDGEARRR